MTVKPPTANHHPPASASSADDRRHGCPQAGTQPILVARLVGPTRATSDERSSSMQHPDGGWGRGNIMFGGMGPVVC